MIKAIETKYNGYKFRSRLEARWAVFFDSLGIKYEYESEGYTLSNGQNYLPDFWLPTFDGGIWCEVKPDEGDFSKALLLSRDTKRDIWLCEGTPSIAIYKLYGYADWLDPKDTPYGSGFIFWCGIPNWDEAYGDNRMFGMPCNFRCDKYLCPSSHKIEITKTVDPYNEFDSADKIVRNSVNKAKCARFEYGDTCNEK